MNKPLKAPKKTKDPAPSDHQTPIHLEYIRHLADISEDNGEEQITNYHRAMFTNKHGAELEQLAHQIKHSETRLDGLEPEWRRATEKLNAIDPLFPNNGSAAKTEESPQPWNHWDRWMFVMAGIGVVCLVVFGVLNISFNLIESGLVLFGDHPYRAYFWAALLPVGALGIKIGWDLITSRSFKSIYVWCCLGTGFLGVLVWLQSYASIYPSLSMSTAEQLESIHLLTDQETADPKVPFGKVKWVDMILVVSQAIAELFLSALLGIYMTIIYQKHRTIKPSIHPEYLYWDGERLKLERSVFDERKTLATARGRMKELDSQLAVYLAYAKSVYQRELVLSQNHCFRKERLLTELTSDVMERLQSIRASSDINHLIADSPGEPASLETKTA